VHNPRSARLCATGLPPLRPSTLALRGVTSEVAVYEIP